MPPKSHEVGLSTPRTTTKPTEASTMTSGSRRGSSPVGAVRGSSGGASSASSPPGIGGAGSRGPRRTTCVPTPSPSPSRLGGTARPDLPVRRTPVRRAGHTKEPITRTGHDRPRSAGTSGGGRGGERARGGRPGTIEWPATARRPGRRGPPRRRPSPCRPRSEEASPVTRVSVLAPGTRADLALPGDVPVAELLPVLVELTGADAPPAPATAYGEHTPVRSADRAAGTGWTLAPLGQAPADPRRTSTGSGVLDGDQLVLRRRDDAAPAPLYDDVVDAVAESTPASYRPVGRRLGPPDRARRGGDGGHGDARRPARRGARSRDGRRPGDRRGRGRRRPGRRGARRPRAAPGPPAGPRRRPRRPRRRRGRGVRARRRPGDARQPRCSPPTGRTCCWRARSPS